GRDRLRRSPPRLREGRDAPGRGPAPSRLTRPPPSWSTIEPGMFAGLKSLFRYRLLIQSLVSRELKARYRGTVLGFFWSFINPLLQLLTYGLVFGVILPGRRQPEIEPYLLFFFCGILPWTWFQSSLTEAAGVLISGGNLIKKVLFPAEILPVVAV